MLNMYPVLFDSILLDSILVYSGGLGCQPRIACVSSCVYVLVHLCERVCMTDCVCV